MSEIDVIQRFLKTGHFNEARAMALSFLAAQDEQLAQTDKAELLRQVAKAENGLGNPDMACAYMEQALARCYHIPLGLRDMGNFLLSAKRLVEARRYYENACALFPKVHEVLSLLGSCAVMQGDLPYALQAYIRYQRFHPECKATEKAILLIKERIKERAQTQPPG